jgi:hypothetical protein
MSVVCLLSLFLLVFKFLLHSKASCTIQAIQYHHLLPGVAYCTFYRHSESALIAACGHLLHSKAAPSWCAKPSILPVIPIGDYRRMNYGKRGTKALCCSFRNEPYKRSAWVVVRHIICSGSATLAKSAALLQCFGVGYCLFALNSSAFCGHWFHFVLV